MKNQIIIISTITIVLLGLWTTIELFFNKRQVESSEVIEVVDPTVNTQILNDLKNKLYF